MEFSLDFFDRFLVFLSWIWVLIFKLPKSLLRNVVQRLCVNQKIIKLIFHIASRQIRIQIYLFEDSPLIKILPNYVIYVLALDADWFTQ